MYKPHLGRRPPTLGPLTIWEARRGFELTPDGAGGTDLLLTHVGVPLDEWNETHAGWLNVLFPLKGVDERMASNSTMTRCARGSGVRGSVIEND